MAIMVKCPHCKKEYDELKIKNIKYCVECKKCNKTECQNHPFLVKSYEFYDKDRIKHTEFYDKDNRLKDKDEVLDAIRATYGYIDKKSKLAFIDYKGAAFVKCKGCDEKLYEQKLVYKCPHCDSKISRTTYIFFSLPEKRTTTWR
ncbi:MAG: hypothetical protein PHW96_02160 [Candidatus Nanoarchaeia archaeon]|nr:hypothetical protein [Candidatus Nanoarchaeia archaeon]